MKIRVNDTVKITLGKDNGRSGKVLRVWSKEGRVLVEEANVYKRHLRRQAQSQGGILDISKPMDVSNVALICPNCQKTTRVGFKTEGDKKIRFCKKCGQVIKEREEK